MGRNSITELVISIVAVVILAGSMIGCESLAFLQEETDTYHEEIEVQSKSVEIVSGSEYSFC